MSCPKCEGTGIVMQYALVVMLPRLEDLPVKFSRRLESEQEGLALRAQLLGHGAEVISAAGPCSCTRPPKEDKPAPPEYTDRKMMQAGDR